MLTIPPAPYPRKPGPSLDDTWIEFEEGDLDGADTLFRCQIPAEEPRPEVMEDGLGWLVGRQRTCQPRRRCKNRRVRKAS